MAGFVEVAPGLRRLSLMPLDLVNVYLLEDVLLDAGGRSAVARLLRALRGHGLTAHVLTHAHFDHQGGSHAVCEQRGVPLWCGRGDRWAVETGELSRVYPDRNSRIARVSDRLAGPGHPVARTLADGDRVGGFAVVETPGHTPGHLAFWRERDRVLVLGDALFHRNPLTLHRGLAEPYAFLVADTAAARESARRLARLEPELVCFGHGPPLRDPARFQAFVGTLAVRGADG
ncbi:MAG: MBL fold metallo-hydrolase [Gemmatimonadetes bacterium]|nr:MBL fold metallo-hydrolase [Gemmatimonadota bacterium]NIQ56250.1 MBL fold metallo-hydrolase [Gemmatimonadota bacterium]NIU76438.1 MBL fold metallo-hydrolase [Gammaproteobacteria bacterium]NIX45915.1 MBL fold metallo-hydrolase [Gemmatimonadota bacterium]NIY10227.1 MBL fold metallo-hydrolase [Gemmatimonadota bacterium]